MGHSPMFNFIKILSFHNCDISPYVNLKAITNDEFKELTGKDFVENKSEATS